jgi:hypothetical protein
VHTVSDFRAFMPQNRGSYFVAMQPSAAAVPDQTRAQRILQKYIRSSALLGVNLDDSLLCDSPGSFVDWAPMI